VWKTASIFFLRKPQYKQNEKLNLTVHKDGRFDKRGKRTVSKGKSRLERPVEKGAAKQQPEKAKQKKVDIRTIGGNSNVRENGSIRNTAGRFQKGKRNCTQ